jgi:hypothetical protein
MVDNSVGLQGPHIRGRTVMLKSELVVQVPEALSLQRFIPSTFMNSPVRENSGDVR